ncbi:MAG: molybdopterin-synthase adenylyltransferase MoeB [Pseudomonadota bacterium]|nr:molybdopterin-synthase adenylyltransferase MoeB [Pseudomonadota bacterium]
MFNDDELLRYSRQIMLPELDISGQEALRDASVLVVGLGGLGSPVALYLAAAGVGRLTLVDHDTVDLTNLQRQIAHTTQSIGTAKVESAATAVNALNGQCQVEAIASPLTAENGPGLVQRSQVIVDCSDNFSVRFLLNRLSRRHRVPLVSGAAIRWDGQLSVYDPRRPDSPCYHCLYQETGEEEEQRCATLGVLSPLVGLVGSLQAVETIKVVTGAGSTLVGRLLLVDALQMRFRELRLRRDRNCPVCGE